MVYRQTRRPLIHKRQKAANKHGDRRVNNAPTIAGPLPRLGTLPRAHTVKLVMLSVIGYYIIPRGGENHVANLTYCCVSRACQMVA